MMFTLEQLCQRLLIKYRAYIGDIGDTPLDLLHPVFQSCEPDDLQRIEEESRLHGRDIEAGALDAYWKQLFSEHFAGGSEAKAAELAGAITCKIESWKVAYSAKHKEIEAKKIRLGRKLREAWQEEAKRKQSRTVKVIKRLPVASRRNTSSTASRQFLGTRARLAKKLKIRAPRVGNQKIARALVSRAQVTQVSPPGKVQELLECDVKYTSIQGDAKTSVVKCTPSKREELQDDQAIIAACKAARLVEVSIDW